MSWRAELDALKRRASTQTQSTTANARKILDLLGRTPDVRKATEEHLGRLYAGVEAAADNFASVTTHGWRLSLSRVATSDGGHTWHLSASLQPRGRSSTTNDWKMLGHFAMHLGAPKDPTILPEDPAGVVHWQWPEAA